MTIYTEWGHIKFDRFEKCTKNISTKRVYMMKNNESIGVIDFNEVVLKYQDSFIDDKSYFIKRR